MLSASSFESPAPQLVSGTKAIDDWIAEAMGIEGTGALKALSIKPPVLAVCGKIASTIPSQRK
jgi:hypothetical protein